MNNSNLGNVSSATENIEKFQLVFHSINGYPWGRNFFDQKIIGKCVETLKLCWKNFNNI